MAKAKSTDATQPALVQGASDSTPAESGLTRPLEAALPEPDTSSASGSVPESPAVVRRGAKISKSQREIELEMRVSELEDERDTLRRAMEPPAGRMPMPAKARTALDDLNSMLGL